MEDFTNLQISTYMEICNWACENWAYVFVQITCAPKETFLGFCLGISNFCKLHMVTCKFLHKP